MTDIKTLIEVRIHRGENPSEYVQPEAYLRTEDPAEARKFIDLLAAPRDEPAWPAVTFNVQQFDPAALRLYYGSAAPSEPEDTPEAEAPEFEPGDEIRSAETLRRLPAGSIFVDTSDDYWHANTDGTFTYVGENESDDGEFGLYRDHYYRDWSPEQVIEHYEVVTVKYVESPA